MGEPLVWSKWDTHCVWCGLQKAGDDEWAVDHDGHHADDEFSEDDDCWCMAFCWDTCGESVFPERPLAELRALVEAQAAVIERLRDHWTSVVDWPDCNPGWERGRTTEPMSPSEQMVVLGQVITEESS